MPIYEYQCSSCAHIRTEVMDITEYEYWSTKPNPCIRTRSDLPLDEFGEVEICLGEYKRKFSFFIRPTMPDHYNQSAGTYVTSEKQLKDTFKRQSEAATIRTGLEHNFVPVDPHDKDRLGVTDQGLRETYDRRKKLGMRIPKVIEPGNMA